MSFMYMYSIENDFPNAKVDSEALAYDIRTSDVTIALDYIFIKDEIECHIFMKAELAEEDHLRLDEVVGNHSGDPLAGVQQSSNVDLTQIVDSKMQALDIDDEGRMKVLSFVTPKEHELSGPQHIGTLSDEQLPDCVARCTDVTTLSGTLTQNMQDFAEGYYEKPEVDDLLLTKSPISHQHDLRYYKKVEVDAKIVTDHGELSGLSDDDHPQYFNTTRGDVRYFKQEDAVTISGTLQEQINNKSDVDHLHDDRYYTESEVDSALAGKSDATHTHKHSQLTDLDDDDHPQYLRTDGSRHVTGDFTIFGNLSVSGTEYVSNTETVEVQDNLMILNKGEAGSGVSKGIAGIEIDRGTSTNYRFVFDEVDGLFKVGISGSEEALTIVDQGSIVEGHIPYWKYHNAGLPHYELTTTDSIHINDIASKDFVNSTAVSLQQNIDGKADVSHTHSQSDITDLVHDATKIQHKPIDAPTPADDGKRIVYDATNNKFKLDHSGAGGGGVSFPFSYFYKVSSPEKVSTTQYASDKWYEKTKMVVNVPAGTYRIGWYYQWLCTSTSRSMVVNLVEDKVELKDYRFDGILYTEVEPKDYRCYYTDGGFRHIELEEGEHTFILRFRVNRSGGVVYMWNAELEFWRLEL